MIGLPKLKPPPVKRKLKVVPALPRLLIRKVPALFVIVFVERGRVRLPVVELLLLAVKVASPDIVIGLVTGAVGRLLFEMRPPPFSDRIPSPFPRVDVAFKTTFPAVMLVCPS